MNLHEHKQIIKRWIRSCDTSEQLDLCKDVVLEFVLRRFDGVVEKWELDEAKTELFSEVEERRVIVAGTPKNYPQHISEPTGENTRTNKLEELP